MRLFHNRSKFLSYVYKSTKLRIGYHYQHICATEYIRIVNSCVFFVMDYPCILCSENVGPRQQAIECDSCQKWQHKESKYNDLFRFLINVKIIEIVLVVCCISYFWLVIKSSSYLNIPAFLNIPALLEVI